MNNVQAGKFIQQGWECPKCGAILAPHQNYCPFCSPSEYGRTNWLGTNTPTSGQYVNPNPSESIADTGKTTTSAKDVGVVYTLKSYSHDGIRALRRN